MQKKRPSIFIGSSSEGLEVAKAIQLNLDHQCEVVLWSQGVFGLSGGTLETLVAKANDFDFAVLVVTADDMIESRKEVSKSPRDNVLIELGLFLGSIGRSRTFIVFDRSKEIKLPSDLAGITLADYQPHDSGNLAAAVGAACTKIGTNVAELGPNNPKPLNFDVDKNTHFQDISNLLEVPARQILILMQEQNIKIAREPRSWNNGLTYEYEMLENRSAGVGAFSMNKMCTGLADADLLQQDLRDNVGLTERGREFARWLTEHGHKARFFRTNVGGWGEPSEELSEHLSNMRRPTSIVPPAAVVRNTSPEKPEKLKSPKHGSGGAAK